MAPRLARGRRPWWFLGLAVLAAALVAGASGAWVRWRQADQGQALRIPDDGRTSPSAPPPTPAPGPGGEARPQGPPFVTSVSPDGRYFLDQYGRPPAAPSPCRPASPRRAGTAAAATGSSS